VVAPLLRAREAVEKRIDDLDRKVLKRARHDAQIRRFMTVPGIGPITSLCFKATIDNPARFRRSRSVGAYVGLTTRRDASGEIDWSGRISKCGDVMLRNYLFEAAGVLLTRVPKWSALKSWGKRLAKRNGFARPKSPLHTSSRSSCIACRSTKPSLIGRTRRQLRNPHRSPNSPKTREKTP
jgi:transposase